MGASSLDTKSIAVLAMDTLKSVGDGQSTKIIFPFEISRMVDGISEYLGITKEVPEREIATFKDLEKVLGKAEDVLGPLPERAELEKVLEAAEKETRITPEEIPPPDSPRSKEDEES